MLDRTDRIGSICRLLGTYVVMSKVTDGPLQNLRMVRIDSACRSTGVCMYACMDVCMHGCR